MRSTQWIFACLALAAAAPARGAIPAEQDDCLGCHGSDPSQVLELPSGEKLSLHVDPAVFGRSVHGEMLRCTDCHADKTGYPHDPKRFERRRDVTLASYEQCKGCHFANYTKTLDGVHFAVIAKGNKKAALCVDCHGAHDISRAGEPRARISRTCGGCHPAIASTFATSVHGRAGAEGIADVPVCTDCHRAHDIADPRDGSLALRTPELCGRCHTDEKLMTRYGLSTKVVDTYLADFHGMSATLQKAKRKPGQALAAVCTDCHGIHDIQRPDDPRSSVMQANLVRTCRKCHPGATEEFPRAWLSHYEPSWKKAGVVHAVQLFYKLFIPFVVGGVILQIALHLWRVVVNR